MLQCFIKTQYIYREYKVLYSSSLVLAYSYIHKLVSHLIYPHPLYSLRNLLTSFSLLSLAALASSI